MSYKSTFPLYNTIKEDVKNKWSEELTDEELIGFRDYLVNTYRPVSGTEKWKDKFRDTHLESEVEYKKQPYVYEGGIRE